MCLHLCVLPGTLRGMTALPETVSGSVLRLRGAATRGGKESPCWSVAEMVRDLGKKAAITMDLGVNGLQTTDIYFSWFCP